MELGPPLLTYEVEYEMTDGRIRNMTTVTSGWGAFVAQHTISSSAIAPPLVPPEITCQRIITSASEESRVSAAEWVSNIVSYRQQYEQLRRDEQQRQIAMRYTGAYFEEVVARGIALLDGKGPHDWYLHINTALLDVSSVINCPLGQLYGLYSTGERALKLTPEESICHGFLLPGSVCIYNAEAEYACLSAIWRQAILQRCKQEEQQRHECGVFAQNPPVPSVHDRQADMLHEQEHVCVFT